MVRLLNEKSHRRDERINERALSSPSLLGEEVPQRIFFNVISFWFAGGDEEGGEEFHQ